MRKKPAAGFILAALLCVGFSPARAYDPNKPWIYSMRFMMDTWGYLEMYSTATVVSKPSNFAALRVVTSTTNPDYQLLVTTQGYVGIATASPAGLFTVGNGTMVVTSGGNVGIGTASPNYELDVNGTANATYFKGDGSQLTNLAVTKVASVSVSGNSATITGLSPGIRYRLVANLTQQTTSSTHYLRINGDADAHYSWANYAWAYTGPSNNCAAGQPAFMLTGNGDPVSANTFIYLEMEFTTWGGGGVNVQYIGKASFINSSGNLEGAVISGNYGGASTAISSITYFCSAGTMGGTLTLYQLN